MAHFPPGLVWLASYPKSGNTWMRILLTNLMAGRVEPVDINRLAEEETLAGRWRFGDEMLVDADLLDWEELERLRPLHCDFVADQLASPHFCKTHDRFHGRLGHPVLGTRARGALYLVRDPRDVAISLAHHAVVPLDEAISLMSDAATRSMGGSQLRYLVSDWGSHVSDWTEQRRVPIKVVRYEDLRRDTAAVLQTVATFLGARVTRAEIDQAVAHSSLTELQRQEAARGFKEARPGQKQFFRSGLIGEWQDVLSAAQVRAVEQRFGREMRRWGYAPSE